MTLFDDAARRKLDQLHLAAPRVRAGAVQGDRRSNKRGSSIEFADYRDYAPGDDLRRLDWNIYARLERPLTKLYEDEQDLAVQVVIDASASMAFPQEGPGQKLALAKRIGAALGLIALSSGDRLTVTALTGPNSGPAFGPARGRAAAARLLDAVEAIAPGGQVDLDAALRALASRLTRAAFCILISDCMAPGGLRGGLSALAGRGCQVAVVHVLAPDEIEPQLNGDLRLIDSESGQPHDVTIDDDLRALYKKKLDLWRAALAADCAARGATFIPAASDAPWERVVLYDLRRAGLVR